MYTIFSCKCNSRSNRNANVKSLNGNIELDVRIPATLHLPFRRIFIIKIKVLLKIISYTKLEILETFITDNGGLYFVWSLMFLKLNANDIELGMERNASKTTTLYTNYKIVKFLNIIHVNKIVNLVAFIPLV